MNARWRFRRPTDVPLDLWNLARNSSGSTGAPTDASLNLDAAKTRSLAGSRPVPLRRSGPILRPVASHVRLLDLPPAEAEFIESRPIPGIDGSGSLNDFAHQSSRRRTKWFEPFDFVSFLRHFEPFRPNACTTFDHTPWRDFPAPIP